MIGTKDDHGLTLQNNVGYILFRLKELLYGSNLE